MWWKAGSRGATSDEEEEEDEAVGSCVRISADQLLSRRTIMLSTPDMQARVRREIAVPPRLGHTALLSCTATFSIDIATCQR